VQLLQEDCIPVYFRYRKGATGNLDEVQIENIAKLSKEYEAIVNAKKDFKIDYGARRDE
jgi:uncharacterized protein